MFTFIIRRISQAIFVMLIISLIGFSIKNKIGDPVRDMVGERVTPQERAKIKTETRTERPFFQTIYQIC